LRKIALGPGEHGIPLFVTVSIEFLVPESHCVVVEKTRGGEVERALGSRRIAPTIETSMNRERKLRVPNFASPHGPAYIFAMTGGELNTTITDAPGPSQTLQGSVPQKLTEPECTQVTVPFVIVTSSL
jgi:hypothetical protein